MDAREATAVTISSTHAATLYNTPLTSLVNSFWYSMSTKAVSLGSNVNGRGDDDDIANSVPVRTDVNRRDGAVKPLQCLAIKITVIALTVKNERSNSMVETTRRRRRRQGEVDAIFVVDVLPGPDSFECLLRHALAIPPSSPRTHA